MKKIFCGLAHYLGLPFVLIAFGWGCLRIKSKAAKYHKDPTSIFPEERFKRVYKLAKKVLYCKNIKIKDVNFEDLPAKASLFIGNHKSNIDPIIMVKLLYEKMPGHFFTFLCKQELAKNKTVKAAIDLIDGIYIDRNNPRQIFEILEKEKTILANNYSLVIFPEGTRVYSNEIGEFKSGAIKSAVDCFVPVIPFAIYNSSGRLDKNKEFKKHGLIVVEAAEIIKPQQFITSNVMNLANRIRDIVSRIYNRLVNENSKGAK